MKFGRGSLSLCKIFIWESLVLEGKEEFLKLGGRRWGIEGRVFSCNFVAFVCLFVDLIGLVVVVLFVCFCFCLFVYVFGCFIKDPEFTKKISFYKI